ncbi:cell division control protein 6 [Geosmithia morbida]|uniref:Cell division control protein n=1 Tax=Geosmithia morbida TaxID=1094350 RepID=A0A9P4YVM4_9HYPO|nr:cell division control protein 6 [Geosmithia morbida]KAF4123357.1 cell division control protein 6 [Geosmithia morbida]
MACSVAGKRARAVEASESPETPSKRTRRATARITDENLDPEDVHDEDDDRLHELPLKRTPKKLPVTPSTPRKRDALAGNPGTPRHAVMSAGKLFKRLTPSSPSSPSTVQTIYHSARQLFAHGGEPCKLIGREEERQQLTDFLDRCSADSTALSPSGCLYVSGPPGTGKSAMITQTLRDYSSLPNVRSAYLNCMSIKSSKDLYATLLAALGDDGDMAEADAVTALQNRFCSKKQELETVYLVTLDEIDHILTMGLESLYRVFEWSLQEPSRLLLVGVANALDLTDRFLPRLKAKNLKPELLPFLPYRAPQIKNIITARLKSLAPAAKEGFVPFIHPAAIELCSRKVASQTGDLRKAFEICRRSLDLIEAETKSKHEDEARANLLQLTPSKKPLGEKVNGSSRPGKTLVQAMTESLKTLTPETAPRASIGHLNKVTAAAFSNGTAQRLKALNLQQKAALCSLVAYENRARANARSTDIAATPSKARQMTAPTIKTLFDTYCLLCTRDSVLHPLSSSEFREVVGSLETLGLVHAVDGKRGSFAAPQTPSKRGRRTAVTSGGDEGRIASAVSDKDMESVAEGIGAGILGSILGGEALD